jgi:predicted XRE-type DNA-binding protein
MKKTKQDRLKAAGWKVGSAGEFLDLSPEEAAFIEMKLALAESIRRRRQRRKMTQTQLAKLLDSSQSRVAKMEAADESVSLDLLVRSLLALGATRRDVAKVLGPPPSKAASLWS